MAQKNFEKISFSNSDNEQRKYDISGETVSKSGTVADVNNISVNREGVQVATATFRAINQEHPNISVNIFGLPMSEHGECTEAIYAFVAEVKAAAEE